MTDTMPDLAGLTSEYSAHNYAPLPVVASSAAGVWVTDVLGEGTGPGLTADAPEIP